MKLLNKKLVNIGVCALMVLVAWGSFASTALAACGSTSFVAARSFVLPPRPRAVAVADFNGDGQRDLVFVNDSANMISVLLGDGAGTFTPPATFTTGTLPVSVAVGDINNDSKIDIVTANTIAGNISIFLGDGLGGFAAAPNLTTASAPSLVLLGDFNLDLQKDLAVALSNGTLLIMLGNGSGTFGAPTNFQIGDRPVGLAPGDFNLDGNPDLALVRQFGEEVFILLGNGTGGFGQPIGFPAGTETSAIAASDFNGDGKLDLAATLVASRLVILLNNGDGTFGNPTLLTVAGNSPASVVASDWNNDGKPDVAVGHNTGTTVRLGNGTGGFGAEVLYSVGLGPSYLAADDFNSDGSSDLVVAGYSASSVALLLNNGAGNFVTAPRFSTGSFSNSVLKGDFDNDGKLDLAVANRNTNDISVLLGTGTGSFGTARRISVGPQPSGNITNGPMSLASGDFNGDSKIDLVTANFTGASVSILIGDGTGDFSATKIGFAGSPWFVAVADFNSDEKLDLVITENNDFNNVSLMFGDGTGNFGAPVDFPGVHGPRPVAVGDLNGDGKVDLAVGNQIGVHSVSIFLGNGMGGFSAPVEFSLGGFNGPRSIAIADFNNDTKPDLVVANESSNDVALLTGNGAGSFTGPVNFSVGNAPTGLTVGDFDGDSLPDVAVANSTSGSISILRGNGAGSFSSIIHYDASPSSSVVAADFNGDGRLDVASDGIRLLLNDCLPTAAASLPTLSINDQTLSEESESGTVSFTVTLSAASTDVVTVQYHSSSQTAVSGEDFQPVSGTLTFMPGEVTKPIVVSLVNDNRDEFTERFSVNLHHPTNATIFKREGIAHLLDSDPEPALLINNVTVNEPGSGSVTAVFAVTLTERSGKLITVNFATADGTATAGADYGSAAGTIALGPGSLTKTISVTVNGDTLAESNETFFIDLSNPLNAVIFTGQGTGTIVNFLGVQLSAENYSVSEGVDKVDIIINRVGGSSGVATVDIKTTDTDNFTTGCSETSGDNAFGRCDFATSVDTLTFADGETARTFSIPIINDSFAEGNETFSVALINASGATLGSPAMATVTIEDNETVTGENPIFTTDFFVRQHYLDFLSREPDTDGFNSWLNLLDNCPDVNNTDPNSPSAICDRIAVSQSFFGSVEFQLKGYFVYRFYKLAFNQLPQYTEIVVDMRAVTGATPTEVFQKKAAFTNNFVLRTEFANLYNAKTHMEYVNMLMDRYGLSSITTPDPAAPDGTNKVTLMSTDLIDRLNGIGGPLTRAQVLRAIADSDQVFQMEFNQAFVAMQYFGYLRRNPEPAGFNSWLTFLNANPTDFRTMVNGFMNSNEYRLRFGPQ